MPDHSTHIEHVPVVGRPSQHADERAIVVFDAETGTCIGHSPHVKVEQVSTEKKRGTITIALKLKSLKTKLNT